MHRVWDITGAFWRLDRQISLFGERLNLFALVFFVAGACALLTLPRKWAPVPLLVSCSYMTMAQGIHLGPFSLPIYRMVLGVGLLRVLLRGERFAGGFNSIDKLMIGWAVWMSIASFFHEWAPGSGPIYTSGVIFNITLVYFLIRIWCRDLNEVIDLARIVALLLAPVALEMLFEQMSGKNLFSVFGGVPDEVFVRDGTLRAQGPFRHPILAGTVGAVCFPLMIGIWHQHRRHAIVGAGACLMIMIASASSGPAMSWLAGLLALFVWHYRDWVRAAWIVGVGAYLSLELLMSRPAYYVISKVDLTGSSAGWHRARLIQSTIEHLSEWWLFGTDHTRHWMAAGVEWSAQHADITNYYIAFAVVGGLPAMVLLIAMMWRAFRFVGEIVRSASRTLRKDKFMIWCFGSGLFAHAATSLSVAYFDQSMIFFWLNIAVISSMHSIFARSSAPAKAAGPRLPQAQLARRAELCGDWGGGLTKLRGGID